MDELTKINDTELVSEAKNVQIVTVIDRESLETATEAQKKVKDLIKKINAVWEDEIKKAHNLHKSLIAKRDERLKPAKEFEKLQSQEISKYLTEQDRLRKEAEKQAELERAEKERKEKERIEKQIQKAIEKGDEEKAEILREKKEEIHVPVSISIPEKPQAQGLSGRKVFKATIKNKEQLIRHLLSMPSPPFHLLQIKETDLGGWMKAMRIKALPGVDAREEIQAAIRR